MNNMYIKDSRVSALVIVTLCLVYSLICMTKTCFSSAMVFIVSEGLLTKTQTGIINGAFYVVYGILQIAGGMAADRCDPTRFVTAGLFGAGVVNLVIFFNHSYSVMLASWAINAVVQFAVWPSVFKLLVTMPERCLRTRSVFIATFSNPVGVIASYLVAAFVTKWQYNFMVSSIAMFISAAVWYVVSIVAKRNLVLEDDIPEYTQEKLNSGDFKLGRAVFVSGIAFVLVVTLIRSMLESGIKNLVPVMIKESYGSVSASFATLLNIVVLASGAFGLFTTGKFYANKFKNEVTAIAVMILIAVPCICLTLLIGKINYWYIIFALAFIVMLMSGTSYFTTSDISIKFDKWGKGATVAGMFNCVSCLGIVATNVVFTAMADAKGWIFTIKSWVILGISGALLCAIAIPMWRNFKKKSDI